MGTLMESRVVVSSVCQNKILDVFATLREETHLSWVVQVSCVYHETGHFSVGAAQARREDAFVAELGENIRVFLALKRSTSPATHDEDTPGIDGKHHLIIAAIIGELVASCFIFL